MLPGELGHRRRAIAALPAVLLSIGLTISLVSAPHASAPGSATEYVVTSVSMRHAADNLSLNSLHEIPTTNAPPPRYWARMAYDAADGYVVLFGGDPAVDWWTSVDDTWTYAHGAWTNVTDQSPISPDLDNPGGASMTYDPVDHEILMVGTSVNNTTQEQTWAFSAGRWTQLHPATEPPARWYAAFGYDSADSEAVLYGGLLLTASGNESWPSDTWVFSNGDWSELFASGPTGQYETEQIMTYDDYADELVMVNSSSVNGYVSTWTFHADKWNFATPGGPLGSAGGMVYDPSLYEVIALLGDTWWANQTVQYSTFSNDTWQNHWAAGSFPRVSAASTLAYDGVDGYLMLTSPAEAVEISTAYYTQTLVLDSMEIGPAPTLSLTIQPSQPSVGEAFNVTASVSGGYGPVSSMLIVWVPGCAPETNRGSETCTVTNPGTYYAFFNGFDQANRQITANVSFTVVELPATDILVGGFVFGAVVGAVAAARSLPRRKS